MPDPDEQKIRAMLSDVYTPEGVETYLNASNRNLNGATPMQFIRAGDGDRVVSEVERLSDGNG